MKTVITNFMTNEMEKNYREKKLEKEQSILELKTKEQAQNKEKLNLEKKRVEGINANIEFWIAERANICETLNKMQNPVSINLNTDIVSSSKRYNELKKQIDLTQEKYEKNEDKVVPKFRILQTEVGITIFVVFVITRITADNEYLLEQISSLSIVEYFYPNIQSALAINFFLQDLLIILGLSIASGILFNNFEWFRSKKSIIISSMVTSASIVGMMAANYMSLL